MELRGSAVLSDAAKASRQEMSMIKNTNGLALRVFLKQIDHSQQESNRLCIDDRFNQGHFTTKERVVILTHD
jgi:hypothetical protein